MTSVDRRLTLFHAARAAAARVVPVRDIELSGVSSDTRSLVPGQLFVALRGPNFDGHSFVGQAERAGAVAALVSDPNVETSLPLVVVEDTLAALAAIANDYRRRVDPTVLAITGSAGKTTTKELVAHLLTEGRELFRTPGNYNNQIGLPLSLLSMAPSTDIAVLELGMSAAGEIAELARICEPDIGLITNVAAAHLETLGTIEGVAAAKGELFAALTRQGTAVVNLDDPQILRVINGCPASRITFGRALHADVRLLRTEADGAFTRATFAIGGYEWTLVLKTPAPHNALNAAAAIAAGLAVGESADLLLERLERFPFSIDRRLSLRDEGGVLWLDDYYNANPLSMRAALQALMQLSATRRIAVLGDMLELGTSAVEAHRALGRFVASLGIDVLIGVGPLMRQACDAAIEMATTSATRLTVEHLADSSSASARVAALAQPGAALLVKGSRGMKMEHVFGGTR
ncbi:MAG: UDP-N-acetylmuramoyl-tripeptide--D-alanyl-D-alanine ligase [Myxococcales bacterium]|nr:UDP-N-acetylmuramoyl-tripeptide--D-alanyl-D-alanine ligase [Myxococcales bacterium]